MKAKSFYKNNKHNNMNWKKKKQPGRGAEKLKLLPTNVTKKLSDKKLHKKTKLPWRKKKSSPRNWKRPMNRLKSRRTNTCAYLPSLTITANVPWRRSAELILNGGEKSISSILPIVDDFERALKNMETATDVAAVKGVELIYNKFMSVLGQNGVKVIETKEQPLDTDYHEAIAVIPAPNEALKGKILDCVQTGYILNDKVIRHAKVVVGE